LRLGQALRAAGRAADAAAVLAQARDRLDVLAARIGDPDRRARFLAQPPARELATALADPPPDRRSQPAFPAGLTAREVEVLRLLGEGATNREIAAALHISVKTVNAHLNSIFNKVECSTRAGAVGFASRHGLLDRADDLSPTDRR
ncbi:MAG TPA: response regulator transcription factor, partial [Dehalococcoidia bacterium]|nr:response regulator transcription factor [Dehalococcoidia bacterium]